MLVKMSPLLRLVQPKRFLFLMSLRTGTELIVLTLVINKVSGFYGLLALFTGVYLSPLQLSMYIYSLLALAISTYLSPHIRMHSPLQCMALAYFYALDSLINAAYTAAFTIGWFMVLLDDDNSSKAPGGKTISDTAGFNDPVVPNASWVEIAPPGQTPGAMPIFLSDDGVNNTVAAVGAAAGMSDVVLHSSGLASMVIIGTLLAIRLYFIIIIFSFARQVLRSHIYYMKYGSPPPPPPSPRKRLTSPTPEITVTDGSASYSLGSSSSSSDELATDRYSLSRSSNSGAAGSASASNIPPTEYNSKSKSRSTNSSSSRSSPPPSSHRSPNPLSASRQSLDSPTPLQSNSRDWSNRLGKLMLSLGRTYWFGDVNDTNGSDYDVEWMHSTNSRLAAARADRDNRQYADSAAAAAAATGNGRSPDGVGERERRRRSGTGPPPLPPPSGPPFPAAHQQHQQRNLGSGSGSVEMEMEMEMEDLNSAGASGGASGGASAGTAGGAGAGGAGAGVGGVSTPFGHER